MMRINDAPRKITVNWKHPKMVRLEVCANGADSVEIIYLSRAQLGILHLMTTRPELHRDDIFDHLFKVHEDVPKTQTQRTTVYRMVSLLKHHGLIVEREHLLYQTAKGRACHVAIQMRRQDDIER